MQIGGIRCTDRRVDAVLVGLDVEAFAARQRRLVRTLGFRRCLKRAVSGRGVRHLGRRAHRVLDRYVDHAAVLLAQFTGCAVPADVRCLQVPSSLGASRLSVTGGMQTPR